MSYPRRYSHVCRSGSPCSNLDLSFLHRHLLFADLAEAFAQEAKESGRDRLLLTAAVPVGPDTIRGGYDVPKLARSVRRSCLANMAFPADIFEIIHAGMGINSGSLVFALSLQSHKQTSSAMTSKHCAERFMCTSDSSRPPLFADLAESCPDIAPSLSNILGLPCSQILPRHVILVCLFA